MSYQQSAPADPESRFQHGDHGDARSSRRLLPFAHLGWSVVILIDAALFVWSVPALFTVLHQPCSAFRNDCIPAQLSLADFRALGGPGPALNAYVAYALVTVVTAALILAVVGALIAWRRWADPSALFVSLVLITYAPISITFGAAANITFGAAHPIHVPQVLALSGPVISVLGIAVTFLFWPVLTVFLLTFPTGRFAPRWSALFVLLPVLAGVLFFVRAPFGIISPILFAQVACPAIIQVYRYARRYRPIQRQQTKWVVGSFAFVSLPMMFVYQVAPVLWPALNTPGSAYRLAYIAILMVSFMPISLGIGIAILRYRLYDIDVIINRTLVYGALTVCVIGIYVLIVGYLGVVLRVGANPVISLVAAAVVAVLFQPLRERLQRGVNRLMYGDRETPYVVLARLDGRLAEALPAETALNTIVATVAAALKLPYAAITLAPPGASDTSGTSSGVGERVAAEHGTPASIALRLPLVYGAERVGDLFLAARVGETSFAPADERLLKDLALHAGVVAHAVRLTADLQAARERLVTAREEERRRLRRDLHDGLGPQLASLTLTLTAAREYLTSDPVAAGTLLADLTTHVQSAITDVRRLVYELRPPALDDLGLVDALRDQASRYAHGGLTVLVDAPARLGPLSAAVEVAAYRVCLEALTNVVRHAQARQCVITVRQGSAAQPELQIEVSDDGVGIAPDATMGVGLRSMRERAEELGGTCMIEPAAGGGTCVRLTWPVPVAEVEMQVNRGDI
jgi:signal transduction histidine kinase